jgi:CheY-like chemotaxis protein
MLRSGSVPEPKREHALEVIERNAAAQVRLVEDLLDVSRATSGKLRLETSPVDLARVAELALEAVRPTADAKGVELVASTRSEGALVIGDADRLQQVIWNLLTNAVKFTSRGGRVELSLQRLGSQLELRVADTGEGISSAFLPFVFERFRQADASLSRAHGGLGLGLAIVRHLVELHGGLVRAESPGEGRGATFSFALPIARVTGDPGALAIEPRRSQSSERPPESCLTGLRVLVVDDEVDTRELIATVLLASGAIVDTAASAESALESLHRSGAPDVIVSDIGMPGNDGYELIRRVRALPTESGGRTPAIALTAYARAEERVRALAAGFDEHVAKPVEPPELVRVIGSLAGLARSDA